MGNNIIIIGLIIAVALSWFISALVAKSKTVSKAEWKLVNDALDEYRSALAREQEKASQLHDQLNAARERLQTLKTERFVYLETTIYEHLENQDDLYDETMKEIVDDMDALKNYRTRRESLSFPVDGESTFDPKDTVLENALLFLSEDHETMAMAHNFFTEEGGNEVRKWK